MERLSIGSRECLLYSEGDLSDLIIEPVDDHDLSLLEEQIRHIREYSARPFALLAVKVDDWNGDLSPWPAPPVFGNDAFAGNGKQLLDYLSNEIIPAYAYSRIYLCGYSLAGLFSLWSAFNLKGLSGIAAVSASFWYKDLANYVRENDLLTDNVYLSLGDREKRSKNPVLASVEENMDAIYDLMKDRCNCHKELNQGNHFVDNDIRMAKGVAWLLESR